MEEKNKKCHPDRRSFALICLSVALFAALIAVMLTAGGANETVQAQRLSYRSFHEQLQRLDAAMEAWNEEDITRSLPALQAQVPVLPLAGYEGERDKWALFHYLAGLQQFVAVGAHESSGEEGITAHRRYLAALAQYASEAAKASEGAGEVPVSEVLRKRGHTLTAILPKDSHVGLLARRKEEEQRYPLLADRDTVTEEEARAVAATVFGGSTRFKMAEEGKRVSFHDDEVYRFYCENAYVDISVRGGVPVAMQFEKRLQGDTYDPLTAAEDFLHRHGYDGLDRLAEKKTADAVIFIFASPVAPTKTVSVGVTNCGEVFSFDAGEYWRQ